MTYLVDAWFERNNPYLKIVDRETGRSIVHWGKEKLNRKLQNGDICTEDFTDCLSQDLVKELFLQDCLEQN